MRGRPAVFLDVETRSFFLFGLSFNAQDTWLLFFLLAGFFFALVFATALLGRAWCGWACPQTVFLEGIFRHIERLVGGTREQRMKGIPAPSGWSSTCSTCSPPCWWPASSATSSRCRSSSR